jgi:hypothetical protein
MAILFCMTLWMRLVITTTNSISFMSDPGYGVSVEKHNAVEMI